MIEVHSRGRDLKRESLSVLSRRVSFSGSQKQNVFDRFRLILGQNRDKSFHFVLLAKWTISFHVQIHVALCVRILVQQLWRPLNLFETNYFSFLKPILLYPQFMELSLIEQLSFPGYSTNRDFHCGTVSTVKLLDTELHVGNVLAELASAV